MQSYRNRTAVFSRRKRRWSGRCPTWKRKKETYNRRLTELDKAHEEVDRLQEEQRTTLEQISGYTAEEAKAELIAKLETEVTHEAAMKIKEAEAHYKEEADTKQGDHRPGHPALCR